MEQLDLAVAETKPTNTRYRVAVLNLDWAGAQIYVGLVGLNGEAKSHTYTGATATTLMNQLNTLNMSTTSLHKRILQRLATDGVLSGTVSGSPD